jgi:hypothetical protein
MIMPMSVVLVTMSVILVAVLDTTLASSELFYNDLLFC